MKAIHVISLFFLLTSCALRKPEQKHNIQQVQFTASACFGACPVFKMTIGENGNAIFEAERFNDVEGKFRAVIEKRQLNSLFRRISEANVMALNDRYEEQVTCMPTYTLEITLKDGKLKTISDYGPSGPEALRKIYSMIFSLRESENWE